MDEDKKKLLNICIAVLREHCRGHEGPCRYCVLFDNVCGGKNKDAYQYPCNWDSIE